MKAAFQMNTDELDATFLERVKAAFPHKIIEIVVSEADETTAILANPELRDRLQLALSDVQAGRNIVTPDQNQFQ